MSDCGGNHGFLLGTTHIIFTKCNLSCALADLGEGGPNSFCIHIHQKMSALGVHTPLMGPCPLVGNPGSTTGTMSISKKLNLDKPAHSSSVPNMDESTTEVQSTHLSQLIEPIIKEFKSLKDTMVSQKSEISEKINRLKKVITSQKSEIINEINIKVDTNSKSTLKVLDENQ